MSDSEKRYTVELEPLSDLPPGADDTGEQIWRVGQWAVDYVLYEALKRWLTWHLSGYYQGVADVQILEDDLTEAPEDEGLSARVLLAWAQKHNYTHVYVYRS